MTATNTHKDTTKGHDTHGYHPALAHHFVSLEQQHEANILGMWVFLVTEVLFFGGMFTAYTVYRFKFNTMFQEASNQLDITLGCLNTVVLILSSLTMAMAVRCAQQGKAKQILGYLAATAVLGFAFLGVKYFEWKHDFAVHLIPRSDFCWDYAKEQRTEADHHERANPSSPKCLASFSVTTKNMLPPRRSASLPTRKTQSRNRRECSLCFTLR